MVFVGESKTRRKVESRTIWGTLSERTQSVFSRDDLSNCADVHDGLLPPLFLRIRKCSPSVKANNAAAWKVSTIWCTLSERTRCVFMRDDLSNCADVHVHDALA